jgi:hypothetical protein
MASDAATAAPVEAAVEAAIQVVAAQALAAVGAAAQDHAAAAAAAAAEEAGSVESSRLQPQPVAASIEPCNEPFTPQQQQQQQEAGCLTATRSYSSSKHQIVAQPSHEADVTTPVAAAAGAAAAVAVDSVGANASALLTKLHTEKQHEVVLASGRCAVQYVPAYMNR